MSSKSDQSSHCETPNPPKERMMRLRHANHSDDTTYHLIETYETQKFTDIVLICGEECTQVIKGHRLMLSKASNYFKKVIETALKHQDGYPVVPFIALKEIPFTDLKAIIDFIYHGKITIPKSQLDSLIRTAKFLEINGLQTLLSQTESIRKPENREVLKNEQETIAQKNSSETKTFEKTAKNDSKPSEIGDTPKDDKTILKQPETPANNAKTGKAVDIPCISNSTSITLTHSDPPIAHKIVTIPTTVSFQSSAQITQPRATLLINQPIIGVRLPNGSIQNLTACRPILPNILRKSNTVSSHNVKQSKPGTEESTKESNKTSSTPVNLSVSEKDSVSLTSEKMKTDNESSKQINLSLPDSAKPQIKVTSSKNFEDLSKIINKSQSQLKKANNESGVADKAKDSIEQSSKDIDTNKGKTYEALSQQNRLNSATKESRGKISVATPLKRTEQSLSSQNAKKKRTFEDPDLESNKIVVSEVITQRKTYSRVHLTEKEKDKEKQQEKTKETTESSKKFNKEPQPFTFDDNCIILDSDED